ncbi:UDP-N-acetylglucosamine-transferase [Paraburkholderia sp. ZP32-5]|uniref:UDP-N-acetylglucosamine-transferase n=1 Tax=Paraburkholderia sp. ZP32-5 TaxID=2883245 RepID=UPI001F2AC42F|nr:UDP-N-acetylglucosamine-transferase [Paraburkholderia sp. ZP32-5]
MTALSIASPSSIFVQIASYRDSQLIPTLLDLINKAKRPDWLRIAICWQHAPDETLGEFWRQGFGKWSTEENGDWPVQHLDYRGAKVELIDIPHMMTQGACWARNTIQQRYGGERYTLQLDSHHRFVEGWDKLVIDTLESLRAESPKPLLTGYLPPFNPANDSDLGGNPLFLCFDRFGTEGVVMFRGKKLPPVDAPVRARFYSGHFTFADGHFAETVQHDPDYFFLGEEISIAVRAFTHGYDLYHPHCLIAWHEYTREYRVKMWDDHTDQAKQRGEIDEHWGERSARAYQRNRALLGVDGETSAQHNFDKYGHGTARTLADYEAYAGISFACRGVHETTLNHEPPLPPGTPRADEATWKTSLRRANDVRVCLHRDTFDKHAASPGAVNLLSCATSANVVVYDDTAADLYSETVEASRLSQSRANNWLDFRVIFLSALEQIPARYAIELFDDAGNLLSRVGHAVVV